MEALAAQFPHTAQLPRSSAGQNCSMPELILAALTPPAMHRHRAVRAARAVAFLLTLLSPVLEATAGRRRAVFTRFRSQMA